MCLILLFILSFANEEFQCKTSLNRWLKKWLWAKIIFQPHTYFIDEILAFIVFWRIKEFV